MIWIITAMGVLGLLGALACLLMAVFAPSSEDIDWANEPLEDGE